LNTLQAQSNPLLTVSPASVSLNYQLGTPPPVQSLDITSSGAALTYRVSTTTASGGNWLFAGPVLAGITPGTLVVGLNPSPIVGVGSPYPPPGTYTGSVILTADGAANSPVTVPVTLNVTAGGSPSLNVSPPSVSFYYQTGGSPPPVQTLTITSTGAALTYRASTTTASGGNWLSAGPVLAGVTPGTLVVGLNPSPIVGAVSPYPPPGTYTGSVILTADGAANSPVAVPVTLTVTAASTQLSQIGGFAHIATGGGWDTTITLINFGTSPIVARLRFWDDNGAPLSLPVVAGQNPAVTTPSFDQTISPGASTVVDLQSQLASTVVGWAEVDASPAAVIGGFAIFQYQDSVTSSQGTSPLTTSTSTALFVPYDNMGYTTGVALANQAATTASLSLKIRDANGTIIGTDSLLLAPNGHTAFVVVGKYPFTSGQRGIIEISSQSSGVSGLGFRFSPTGSFTSVPVTFR
jgi:hypothetical protein